VRISNSVKSPVSVEPLESSGEPTSSASTAATSTSADWQAAPDDSEVSSLKLPARPADDPLAKAFLLQKLDAAGGQSFGSAPSIWKEGKLSNAGISTATVGGTDANSAGDEASVLADQLAKALDNVGISVDPDDLSKVSNSITEGGEGAMAVAFMITTSITEAQVEQSNEGKPTSGDPTEPASAGNTTTSTSQFQISQKQADQFTAALSSEDDSSSQLSQLLLTELNRLKKK
jgi:hypothetical protein